MKGQISGRCGHLRQRLELSRIPPTTSVRVVVTFFILSGFLLISTATSAAGQVVYKWKDAGGAVHYTDTPPPAGAILLNGPKLATGPGARTAATPARKDKPMLSAPCRSDITAAECGAARRALQADLEDLERTAQAARKGDKGDVSRDQGERRVATLRAKDCSETRNVLMHLKDRQSGKSTEILTTEERASVPAQIAEAEGSMARYCK